MNPFAKPLKWITSLLTPKTRTIYRNARPVRASYDAAQTTDENRRWWINADSLSARAANSYDVRHKLRTRSRYEVSNNSYAKGAVLTLADDTIGSGPRLQCLLDDKVSALAVETAWAKWADAVSFGSKLHTLKQAKTTDGEGVMRFFFNPKIDAGGVTLDLDLVEADQMTTSDLATLVGAGLYATDGIEFDANGNVKWYYFLDQHPGDAYRTNMVSYKEKSRNVVHWFRKDRPGQVRGIPEMTPALNLFSMLRQFTLAVLRAAETAADFAVMLETIDTTGTTNAAPSPFDTMEIERGMMTELPGGTKASQLHAEQPVTTFEMFEMRILNQIGRCISMPMNKITGNSSGYNFSSGRLDHQGYYTRIKIEQIDCERVVCAPTFAAWLDEARLIPGLLPPNLPEEVPVKWYWKGQPHIDPSNEAAANETNLRLGTDTLAGICAKDGEDWEEVLEQRARESAKAAALGITLPWMPAPVTPAAPAAQGAANAPAA